MSQLEELSLENKINEICDLLEELAMDAVATALENVIKQKENSLRHKPLGSNINDIRF